MCNMSKLKYIEKKKLTLRIYDWNMDVNVPKGEEQRYVDAARKVSERIEAYVEIYVRQQYVPQKSYMEILLMTLLDFAVTSTERENVFGFNKLWRRINNIIKHK